MTHLPSRSWIVIAALCVLAPALGGTTRAGPLGFVIFLTGLLFLLAPPRRSLAWPWHVGFLLLGLGAFTAFLPASWFSIPPWRQQLLEIGALLPGTRSPQPWMSGELTLIYFMTLAWAYYLLAFQWEPRTRLRACQIYVGGITLLATVAIAAYFKDFSVPIWPADTFGFFPNRNHTANVTALAGIMITGLLWGSAGRRREGNGKRKIADPLSDPRPPTSDLRPPTSDPRPPTSSPLRWIWFLPLAILGCALGLNTSRAGIGLFFGGSLAAVLWSLTFANKRKTAALCLAGFLLLLTAFLLFGGKTLERFQPAMASWADSRIPLQADAFALSAKAPLLGLGLANFEPVFAMHREKSGGENRALHPESDWLWTAIEMGWPTVLLILGGLALWLRECRPFAAGSDRYLRAAAAVCALSFAIHGLVDVSGHRVGALWPALFFLSLALPRTSPTRGELWSCWIAPGFRTLGLLLLMTGAAIVAASQNRPLIEGLPSQRLEHLRMELKTAIEDDDFEAVITLSTASLRIAPLDWIHYYERARAEARSMISFPDADRDFALARQLRPDWIDICWNEGLLWVALDEPERALAAWKETLRRAELRASASRATELYAQMWEEAEARPVLIQGLRSWVGLNRDYRLILLGKCAEFESEIASLLASDPTLLTHSEAQKKRLFEVWYARGDRAQLTSALQGNPAWMSLGWKWVARDAAERGDFEGAYKLAGEFGAKPILPQIRASESIQDLERKFHYRTEDLPLGLALYAAQKEEGQTKPALATLRILAKLKPPPPYLGYLESELWAQLGDWEKAWKARSVFSDQ